MTHAHARWSMLALATVVSACGADPKALSVEIVTGLVAGTEFTSVNVDLVVSDAPGEAVSIVAHQESQARIGADFSSGARVASFLVADGVSRVRVRLMRRDGSLLVENSVRVNVADHAVVRVHLTRDCVGVACPSPGGSAALTSCLSGMCVPDTCDPLLAGSCEAVTLCASDAQCPAVAACAENHCVDGVCVESPRAESSCEDDQWCNPELGRGCEEVPTDIGAMDAGVDDAGDADAMPLFDGGSDLASVTCGTACVIEADPCSFARWDCSGSSPLCRAESRWPAGHTCGENRVCSESGVCNECHDGAPCRTECVLGTVQCDRGETVCVLPFGTPPTFAPVGTSCSVSEICVDDDEHPCGSGAVCDDEGECVPCIEGMECAFADCSRGRIDCSSAGTCVPSSGTASAGTVCAYESASLLTLRPSAFCDTEGSCVECAHNVACDTGDVCRRGRTDCELGPDVCFPFASSERSGNFGASCPGGACDGYGSCVAPREVIDVDVGASYSCAVDVGGAVLCWGLPTDAHLLGVDGTPAEGERHIIAGLSDDAVDVSVGPSRACARLASGSVECWGAISPLASTSDATPHAVTGLAMAVSSMGIGAHHECFLLADKTVACWGAAFYNGSASDNDLAPLVVPGVSDVDVLRVSTSSTCALTHDGTVKCWGEGPFNTPARLPTLVRSYSSNYPVADETTLPVLTHVVAMSMTATRFCAYLDFGYVTCYGDPTYDTSYFTYLSAQSFALPFTDVADIWVGEPFGATAGVSFDVELVCVRRTTGGEVWCAGNTAGIPGAPGDGPLPGVSDFHRVLDFSTPYPLSIGVDVICGRTAGNALTCWGGTDAELGLGAGTTRRAYPTLMP